MSDDALQQELDRRLHVTAADRAELKAGQLPAKYAQGAQKLGCLAFGVALLGAVAGALFGWNVYPVLPHDRLPDARTFVIATAVVGFVISWIVFRRRFGRMLDDVAKRMRAGRVSQVVVTGRLALEQVGAAEILVFAAEDGRRFECPRALRGVTFEGRARVSFLDFSDVRGGDAPAALPFSLPHYVVAIEVV